MIYTGPDTKPAKAQPRAAAGSSAQQTPPAYDGYQAIPAQSSPFQPLYPRAVGAESNFIANPPQRTSRRFLRAFLVAVGIWVLLTILFRTTIHLGSGGGHGGWDTDKWSFDIPPTVNLGRCVQSGSWTPSRDISPFSESQLVSPYYKYKSETSFSLPLSSSTLFLLSRGQSIGGVVQVKTSTEQEHDSAKVDVVLRYNYNKVIDRVKACLVKRKNNENGVGIFGPTYQHESRWEYRSYYEITVTLPDPGRSGILHINNFETDIHNGRHALDDLSQGILFDSISLLGTNGRIDVKSIKINNGSFTTTNGAISGAYDATKKISLLSTNGAIDADVGLKGEKNYTPQLVARTTNGHIDTNIRLSTTSGRGGSFNVATRSSNGRLDVKFPESPVGSKLVLDASTTNGRATVHLNPAYEGSFTMDTSLSSSVTVHENRVEDPSGGDRQRLVVVRQKSKGHLAGDISWGGDSKGRADGKVTVRTSNGAALLEL